MTTNQQVSTSHQSFMGAAGAQLSTDALPSVISYLIRAGVSQEVAAIEGRNLLVEAFEQTQSNDRDLLIRHSVNVAATRFHARLKDARKSVPTEQYRPMEPAIKPKTLSLFRMNQWFHSEPMREVCCEAQD